MRSAGLALQMFSEHQNIGPYLLIRKIGKGGFGEVWLAEKRSELVTRQVAVKLPLDDQVDLESIKHEASLWEKASGHPNVLPIIDADIYDGQVVIVSEYADGGSLHGWLARYGGKAPSINAAVDLMLGILSGIAHLHQHKITHRDLKPNNILMHRGIPRIADFGIARIVEHSSHGTEALGTPIYMSPEAFRKSTSPTTDIWSAGVVFYELLSGGYPFYDDDVFTLMDLIRHDPPNPIDSQFPAYLREFLNTALEKDPEQRFRTALQMKDALSKFSFVGGPEHLLDTNVDLDGPAGFYAGQSARQLANATTLPFSKPKPANDSVETIWRPAISNKRLSAGKYFTALTGLVLFLGIAFFWARSSGVVPAANKPMANVPQPQPANSIDDREVPQNKSIQERPPSGEDNYPMKRAAARNESSTNRPRHTSGPSRPDARRADKAKFNAESRARRKMEDILRN